MVIQFEKLATDARNSVNRFTEASAKQVGDVINNFARKVKTAATFVCAKMKALGRKTRSVANKIFSTCCPCLVRARKIRKATSPQGQKPTETQQKTARVAAEKNVKPAKQSEEQHNPTQSFNRPKPPAGRHLPSRRHGSTPQPNPEKKASDTAANINPEPVEQSEEERANAQHLFDQQHGLVPLANISFEERTAQAPKVIHLGPASPDEHPEAGAAPRRLPLDPIVSAYLRRNLNLFFSQMPPMFGGASILKTPPLAIRADQDPRIEFLDEEDQPLVDNRHLRQDQPSVEAEEQLERLNKEFFVRLDNLAAVPFSAQNFFQANQRDNSDEPLGLAGLEGLEETSDAEADSAPAEHHQSRQGRRQARPQSSDGARPKTAAPGRKRRQTVAAAPAIPESLRLSKTPQTPGTPRRGAGTRYNLRNQPTPVKKAR